MKIYTYVELNIEDFAIGLEYEEARKVIEIIDKEQSCANFTFDMAKYFIKEVKKFDECGEWVKALKKELNK